MEWVPGNPNDRSVRGFRIRHGSARGPMSKSAYYVMKSQGRGPVEIQVRGVIVITAKGMMSATANGKRCFHGCERIA